MTMKKDDSVVLTSVLSFSIPFCRCFRSFTFNIFKRFRAQFNLFSFRHSPWLRVQMCFAAALKRTYGLNTCIPCLTLSICFLYGISQQYEVIIKEHIHFSLPSTIASSTVIPQICNWRFCQASARVLSSLSLIA